MSTLSAKCDRLRERAEEMRFLAPDPDVPYLVPSTKEIMALAMRSAASEMDDAADTIWQLRNTNLDTANENDDLKAENAKLRELVKYTLLCCERDWPCEKCPLCGERGASIDVDGREVTYTICKARDTAQGLGIEVDE